MPSSSTPEETTPQAASIDSPPIESPIAKEMRSKPSQVIVNTGDGKGKSTAAFGTMLRALARDWPVAVVQFLKSNDWKVGEEAMGRKLGVDWWALGDGFTWDSENLTESEAVAREAWNAAKTHITSGNYRLVIVDEITYPMNWGWIDSAEVVDTIHARPEHVSVICTGRDAPAALMAIADTVTTMDKVRHAYDQGIRAKRGLDY
jgi:cob(I)alamin adenosyltransferase